jgi:hypothetical protein
VLRVRYLLVTAALLWPPPASAQPLFHVEHNWTVLTAEGRYGVWELVQVPGDLRRAQVWFGRRHFDVKCRLAAAVTVAVPPPVNLVRRYWGVWERPRGRPPADTTKE